MSATEVRRKEAIKKRIYRPVILAHLSTESFELTILKKKRKVVKKDKRERALVSRKRSVRWRGANRETDRCSSVRHRFSEIREKCLFVP